MNIETINTSIILFQTLAQMTAVPFIMVIISALKGAGLIKSGYTPLYAIAIGSIMGIAIFVGMNDWSLLNVILGIILGGMSGASAVGLHTASIDPSKNVQQV